MAAIDNERMWNRENLTREYTPGGTEQVGAALMLPELAILGEVWHELSGRRILDLGLGGGRTTQYLLVLSDHYVGLDYSPSMVATARQTFPAADIRQGDARDLSVFADASFEFVLFSYNGIDMVPPTDRRAVLREVHRVLAPSGYFAFSTHNLNCLAGEVHGVLKRPQMGPLSVNPLRSGVRIFRWTRRALRCGANYRRLRSGEESGDGYAVLNDGVHEYSFLTCYVDPRVQCDELDRVGFAPRSLLFGRDGRPTTLDSKDRWLHFLVQKPATDS